MYNIILYHYISHVQKFEVTDANNLPPSCVLCELWVPLRYAWNCGACVDEWVACPTWNLCMLCEGFWEAWFAAGPASSVSATMARMGWKAAGWTPGMGLGMGQFNPEKRIMNWMLLIRFTHLIQTVVAYTTGDKKLRPLTTYSFTHQEERKKSLVKDKILFLERLLRTKCGYSRMRGRWAFFCVCTRGHTLCNFALFEPCHRLWEKHQLPELISASHTSLL